MNNFNKRSHKLRIRILYLVKSQKMQEYLRFKVKRKGRTLPVGEGLYTCIMHYDTPVVGGNTALERLLNISYNLAGKLKQVCSQVQLTHFINEKTEAWYLCLTKEHLNGGDRTHVSPQSLCASYYSCCYKKM